MGLFSPRPPWLATLPDHPARRFVRRVMLCLLLGLPVLPLLSLSFVRPPGVAILVSLILAVILGIAYVVIGGLLKLMGKLQQYCPQCFTVMHIGARVCPACQFMPDPAAVREASPRHLRFLVVGSLLGGFVATGSSHVHAEGARYFDCPVVAYFGEACPGAPAQAVLPELAGSAAPSLEEPLFTPQTVSRDTPPLMLRLLQEPNEVNALAYLTWHRRRLERIKEVQMLLEKLMGESPVPREGATDRDVAPSKTPQPADG